MLIFKKIVLGFTLFAAIGLVNQAVSQHPTYVVDSDFSTGGLFKGGRGVQDFYFTGNNRILVGGGFVNEFLGGMGMIYPNGQLDNSWEGNGYEYYNVIEIIAQEDGFVWPTIYGLFKTLLNGMPWHIAYNESWGAYFVGDTFNPYNVLRVWDIYQMENGDLLLGGAIANDTLLPYELRGISRIHADGSHDPTFPVLNITPNYSDGAVREIYRGPDSSWYISGSFTAINGHETNHVAKLTPDFEVDTTFVSPFMYDGPVDITEDILLVDDQNRIWVSGYNMRLQENPSDIIQIIRLLPDGEVDETFLPRKLENNYPEGWIDLPCIAYEAREIEAHPGNYFIYGSFSHFNDTAQPCITVVNDAGVIQNNFLQNQGATEHHFYINSQIHFKMPRIDVVKQRPDGSIFVGGTFAEFMGETHYSMVKLKPGFVGVEENEQGGGVKVYPNPANDFLRIVSNHANLKSGTIFNALGKKVARFSVNSSEEQVDISSLNSGIYFIQIKMAIGDMVVKKFVKM